MFIAVVLLFSSFVAADCGITVNGEPVTFEYVGAEDNTTIKVSNIVNKFDISLCDAKNFSIGGSVCGFGYFMNMTEPRCSTVFDVATNITYNETNGVAERSFTTSQFGADTVKILIRCSSGAEGGALVPDPTQPSTTESGVTTLYFVSMTVCPGYAPPEPPAEEENKLKTGAIVGIIIGVVALIVLGAAIFTWKSKASNDGQYQSM